MFYPNEQWTPEEEQTLQQFFTNTDKPVFAIKNLPETVRGALFARYSRYEGSLRRLFLDEFATHINYEQNNLDKAAGSQRAAELYERIFVGFGDDSVAQLGGAHIACEYSSNILTKLLQRPRIAAYLEQSTRYIPYDKKMPHTNSYRFYSRPEWGSEWQDAMTNLFDGYSQLIPLTRSALQKAHPLEKGGAEGPWKRALDAKGLDLLRGLLPAATLSHMGMYASGQTYENLILHLLAHPLPEAREYGEMMLSELKEVIPSFLTRIERPERGGKWIEFLQERRIRTENLYSQLDLDKETQPAGPSVKLLHASGSLDELLAAEAVEAGLHSEEKILRSLQNKSSKEKAQMLQELVGERENRRHRPGRGFERLWYRFEIESDYGAFRDLQRHRMCTIQWQQITPQLGADVPEELREFGLAGKYEELLDLSTQQWQRLCTEHDEATAQYAVCLAFRMRYTIHLNAREAMQMIELRSGREGHPSYRAVAHEMHRQIAQVHPEVAQAMQHVDSSTEPRLERLLSEIRNENKSR